MDTHTITIERVTSEMRRDCLIPAGHTIAVVERLDAVFVKVCHAMNRRSPTWRDSAMSVAVCYANTYGAKFVVPRESEVCALRARKVRADRLTRGMMISLYGEDGPKIHEISYVDHGKDVMVTMMNGLQVPYPYDYSVTVWNNIG